MRKNKKTFRVLADVMAVCNECCTEAACDASKWAREHALKTGHCPTVIMTYDVHAVTPGAPQ